MLETVEDLASQEAWKKAEDRLVALDEMKIVLDRKNFEILRRIQEPIVNPYITRGHLNPTGLGGLDLPDGVLKRMVAQFRLAGKILNQPISQSSVDFINLKAHSDADEIGKAPYEPNPGAEYAIPLSPEADAVCKTFTKLHGGAGAIICPSGLSAITTTLNAFETEAILVPDNVYYPLERFAKNRKIEIFKYPAGAAGIDAKEILLNALHNHAPSKTIMYMEAPCSGTFEIADIDGLVSLAEKYNVRTVMDNTWASHVRFTPILRRVAVVIQATTKHEGGNADTPSGVVIARTQDDFNKLSYELRCSGNGAVSPLICNQLNRRVHSTQARMDQHFQTSQELMDWLSKQRFVKGILSPALDSSVYHARYMRYFGRGNGLFSVVFKDEIPTEKVEAFINALNFFHVAESWGGHVSLVLPVHPRHKIYPPPIVGTTYRFHAGLEPAAALLYDLQSAALKVFNVTPTINFKRGYVFKPRHFGL